MNCYDLHRYYGGTYGNVLDEKLTTEGGGQILENKEISITFTYGDFDQFAYVTDDVQNTTQILYDRRGRRRMLFDPDAGVTWFHHNGFGELTMKVAAASVTTYPHDVLGRVDQVDDPDGTTTYLWDTSPHGKGRLTKAASPDGTVQNYAYDPFGRLTEESWSVGGESFVVERSYDPMGSLQTTSVPAAADSSSPT